MQAESLVLQQAVHKLQRDADDRTLFPMCKLDRRHDFVLPPEARGIRTKYKGHAVLGLRDDDLSCIVASQHRRPLIDWLRRANLFASQGHGHVGTVQITRPMRIGGRRVQKPRLWMIDLERLRSLG
jgi:hypothetical protein